MNFTILGVLSLQRYSPLCEAATRVMQAPSNSFDWIIMAKLLYDKADDVFLNLSLGLFHPFQTWACFQRQTQPPIIRLYRKWYIKI